MRIMRAVFFLMFVLAVPGASLHANSLLISPNPNQGQKFPLQGDCARNGIGAADPGIDLTRATWACTGASSQMARIFYREGPEECVYIDNFSTADDTQPRAFFVPLQTSDEWAAFAANLPGGVRLRYGCQGVILRDACGNAFELPDAQASDNTAETISITTANGHYRADYACPLTTGGGSLQETGGCGAWVKVKESGDCGTALSAAAPGAAPVGTTTGGGATTGIPQGETSGAIFAIPPATSSSNGASGSTSGTSSGGATTTIPQGETPSAPIRIPRT